MQRDVEKISVLDIFDDIEYLIPVYQRNFAWTDLEIIQLMEDICDSEQEYFLGSLIIDRRNDGKYEVIDGQQRLTVLYLLKEYLRLPLKENALYFETREKSNRTLSHISKKIELGENEESEDLLEPEILRASQIINSYFKMKSVDEDRLKEKLKHISLVRVQVAKNMDLNHYFELMNTRGEQLELHEIAKAKILRILGENERKAAAMIWETCSNMASYVQMNFNPEVRSHIFSQTWSDLHPDIKSFDDLKRKFSVSDGFQDDADQQSLRKILENNEGKDHKPQYDEGNDDALKIKEQNQRFESVISFPDFLLQVNAVARKTEEGTNIDVKNFFQNISWVWSSPENAGKFLFHLLKCRVLFDRYILKRKFSHSDKETGEWSLQGLEKDKDQCEARYIAALDDENQNRRLRTLQSCLRITYTSPKAMHWITITLIALSENPSGNIIELLENYCKKKVQESNYRNKNAFEIDRIVFSYLDYLIYRDGYAYDGTVIISKMPKDWKFQFRSSIEHFYPQNPPEKITRWNDEDLHGFGNLALITISGNSRFSNLLPTGKMSTYPSIINQSLKLKIMETMTRSMKSMAEDDGKWTEEKARIHRNEMFKLLG